MDNCDVLSLRVDKVCSFDTSSDKQPERYPAADANEQAGCEPQALEAGRGEFLNGWSQMLYEIWSVQTPEKDRHPNKKKTNFKLGI